MARYIFQGTFKDGNGHIVLDGTISVFLSGTSTAASVYENEVGGTSVNSVTSDSTDGSFSFWVDTADYSTTQRFKITLSKTNFRTHSYDDIVIFPVPASANDVYFTTTGYTDKVVEDLVDAGYDLGIKPGTIFGGSNNTVGHTVPNVADDTFCLIDATQNLANKTLINPVINNPDINGGTVDAVTSLTVANNVDIGNFNLRAKTFQSDVATGTPPLTVSSTTVVSNLNSDKLDGQEGSYYTNADNLSSGTLPAARFSDTAHGSRGNGTLHSAGTESTRGFLELATSAETIAGTDTARATHPKGVADAIAAAIAASETVILQHQEATTVDGGSTSAATWNKYDINTVVSDDGGNATLSSGVITLQAGTYKGFIVGQHAGSIGHSQLRLRNTSDNTTAILGASNTYSVMGSDTAAGIFTIASAKNFEVQLYTQTAVSTLGLGSASNSGENEVYAVVYLEKIA